MVKDDIIKKENIMQLPDGTPVNGYAFIRGYTEQPTKNGGTFLGGRMDCVGNLSFKVWGGPTLNKMLDENYADNICYVHGEVNEYAGSKSVIIKECEFYAGNELAPEDFLDSKYDADELYTKLHTILEKNCTPQAVQVFDMVINPIKERFCKEFAAVSHHDACLHGLLAHTSKTVRMAQIVKFYPIVSQVVDKDTLFVATALHDIGKTVEYNNGSLSELGLAMSHLTLGLELIRPYKDTIIELKGEKFYNDLEAVIQQHHGEYGERPRTLIAYIVHVIDGLEASLTDVDEAIEKATGNQIKIKDFKLSF